MAPLTCAGADTLVIVVDALMAQVWAVSTALEVDPPQSRAGADWMCIFVCVQPDSTTLFWVPFPLPTPQGAGIGNSGTSPRPRFEGCATQPSGQEATSANLFRKECQGCNEARKPSCPAPQFNLPRNCHLPAMVRLTGGYAPRSRAGADWMFLVLAEDTWMTHAGTSSIALIVDAPMI
jgi:hypothetical protein